MQRQLKTVKDIGKITAVKGKKFPDFKASFTKKGTGGRSSNSGITATIFGASGFVGIHLTARLGKFGTQLVIPYRGSRYEVEKQRIGADLGQMYFTKFHLKDEDSIYEAVRHSNVVINLIGKQSETRNFSFDDVHVHGARRLARISREVGVKKFIHMSSLNANPSPVSIILKNGSQFLRSKYDGELAVREEFPEAIIFRPSDILGDHDNFLNHFASLQRSRYTRKLALWDYYEGVTKQPIYIKNVCDAIEKAIFSDSADGKTFSMVGPHRYNFYQLIDYIRNCAGMGSQFDRRVVNLRWDIIMRTAIYLCTKLQKYPFLTWERCEVDSTSDYVDPNLPTLTDLGVELEPIETYIRRLAYYRPREHRVEISFEAHSPIELPRRLDMVM